MCGISITARNFVPWFLGVGFSKSILLIEILSFLVIFTGIRNIIGEQYLLPNKKDKQYMFASMVGVITVSYTHLTLPTNVNV